MWTVFLHTRGDEYSVKAACDLFIGPLNVMSPSKHTWEYHWMWSIRMRRQLEDNQELFGIVIPPACLGIYNGISKKTCCIFFKGVCPFESGFHMCFQGSTIPFPCNNSHEYTGSLPQLLGTNHDSTYRQITYNTYLYIHIYIYICTPLPQEFYCWWQHPHLQCFPRMICLGIFADETCELGSGHSYFDKAEGTVW